MRIDFYILRQAGMQAMLPFACRLIEKAYTHQHSIFVYVDNQPHAEQLNDLLWTYADSSFIPHALANSALAKDTQILLGTEISRERSFDMLINLSLNLPENWQHFSRLIEIIPEDEIRKLNGRQHFQHYKDAGITPQTHVIEAA